MLCNRFYSLIIKRLIDLLFSIILILCFSPILIIIAFLVKIKLGSPIIFRQKRPGLDEKLFKLYKFRTMKNIKDKNGELLPDSVRLTKFGELLRRTSLDELPELFNIIKGEMSLVGPRPLSELYLPYYSEEEHKRHLIRPGLTGLAQIKGRNYLSWEERFELDLYYVENVSLSLDLNILFKTLFIVIKRSDIGIIGIDFQDNSLDDVRKEKLN
ncbi:MAG: sugar transferase [Bacteroidota bacterium]